MHARGTSRPATTSTTSSSGVKRPELVLVSFGFYNEYPGAMAWQAFVTGVRERLEAGYTLVSETPSGFQVWRRTDLAES